MKYSSTIHPLQTLITGDTLSIAVHKFTENVGPSCFLQANLHGPEIFGSALLIKLIQYIRAHPEELLGSLTIVPQANPVGVQHQIYGYQIGRWNLQNGKNWNRIFNMGGHDDSLESSLRDMLFSFADGHDIILDIHTSGAACAPHTFSSPDSIPLFTALESRMNILIDDKDYYGAFDESCVRMAKKMGRHVHAATWEVSCHGTIEADVLESRFRSLLCFLREVGVLDPQGIAKGISVIPHADLNQLSVLHASDGGYLVWVKEPGEKINAGDVYGHIYKPQDGSIVELMASRPFFFLIRHPLQAVSSGQEIAEVIYT